MPSLTQRGLFVLADISGYTGYLAAVELEHAHEIVRELLEFIVAQLRPALTLAQIEGDAVLAYTPDEQLTRGETVLEIIEATYGTFKDHLTRISRRLTCTCAACRNVITLDLKFVVHHGEYLAHQIHDQPELLGLAPMFVRERGWKEPMAETTGWRGYALFTEAGLARLGLQPDGLQTIDVDGVKAYGLNLLARHEERLAARYAFIAPEEADVALTRELPAPPPVVWEWLNDPEKRTRWMAGRTWRAGRRLLGRTGVGAQNHCTHSAGAIVETIVDWRPFDYFTVETKTASGWLSRVRVLVTYHLEPFNAGRATRLTARAQLPLPRWLARPLARLMLARLFTTDGDALTRLITDNQ